jgi:uncharacterized repeat protein (TIGR01451 family)
MSNKARAGWMLMGMLLLTTAATANAQDRGCVELKTVAEVEQQYTNEQGKPATRLVPAEKVVPGNEVVWTITARNLCDKPVADVVIANPVPEQMTYVQGSAIGIGTDIQYSLDGKTFASPASLTVRDANGTRAARPDEYRAVRWTYKAAFPAGATAFVRYRALVK